MADKIGHSKEEVVDAFLERYLRDRERGEVRPLAEYQKRFPGHEDLIAERHESLGKGGDTFSDQAETRETPPPGEQVAAPAPSDSAETIAISAPDPGRSTTTILPDSYSDTGLASLPEKLGNYRLLNCLGSGGMGSVYEAEESDSGQRVALKVIHPDLVTSSQAMDRFIREGKLASSVSHPRCVFVLETAQSGKFPYIVMELVKGADLNQHVTKNGRLEIFDALRKTIDIIDGLEAAHGLGVIHRDVKPSNCFLGDDGRVKVGDFGLSRTLAEDAQLTVTGSFIGTPLFTSPEQIRNEKLDERTDIYSVASTLYFLLTGQAPFQSDNAMAVMARIVADPVPPVRDLRPEIHRAIASVIHRGLETDRDKRWQSMADFRNALLQFLPEYRTPVGEMLRYGAYLIDGLLVLLPLELLLVYLESLITGVSVAEKGWWSTDYQQMTLGTKLMSNFISFFYFVFLEARFGCTAGKWLCGFRVRRLEGGPLPFMAVLGRTAFLFFWMSWLSVLISLLPFGGNASMPLSSLAGIVGLVVILCTMRARYGYRGMHDIVSGALVVKLPSRRKIKKRVTGLKDTPEELPTVIPQNFEMPPRLGGYRIQGALFEKDDELVLDAEDDQLQRNVWIHLRGPSLPPVSPGRRNIARLQRLRWLGCGDHDGRHWDAYLAPRGMTLGQYIEAQGKTDWLVARDILLSLAAELEIAVEEDTLPRALSVDHIWLQPDGSALLLDFDLYPDAAIVTKDSQTAEKKAKALLVATAICCLEDEYPAARELAARSSDGLGFRGSVSSRLMELLASCLEEAVRDEPPRGPVGQPDTPEPSLRQFRTGLEATKNPLDIPRVGFFRRLRHLIVHAAVLGISISFISLGGLDGYSVPVLACMIAWTGFFQGGVIFRGARMAIVRQNGTPASGLCISARAFLAWVPFLILLSVPDSGLQGFRDNPERFGILAIALAIHVLAFPRCGLHDLIAGTRVVPR